MALSKTSYRSSLQVCKFTENNFKDKIDNNWILFCITNLNDGIQLMHQSSERSELRLHTQVTTSEEPLSYLGDRDIGIGISHVGPRWPSPQSFHFQMVSKKIVGAQS